MIALDIKSWQDLISSVGRKDAIRLRDAVVVVNHSADTIVLDEQKLSEKLINRIKQWQMH